MPDLLTVQQAAVAISALVATITFIYKVVDDRISRKEAEILDWQKTVVHSIFQKNKAPWLSFETIIGSYRGEAADVPNKKLPKDVLTSAALRKILISMVSERVVDQRGGDEYQLLTHNREEAFQGMMEKVLEGSTQDMFTNMVGLLGQSQDLSHQRSKELQEKTRDMAKEMFAELFGGRLEKVFEEIDDKPKK